MLTKEDLQAIAGLISQSEERTKAEFEKVNARFEKMNSKMDSLNAKMDTMYVSLKEDMETVRREIKVDIENGVEKNVRAVLDGHAALKEKLDDIIDRVETAENIEPRVVALEVKVKENSADITNLKKAQ